MMTTLQLPPFKLERYLARHEFEARHFLSASDCETLALSELLALADPASRDWWAGLRLGYTEAAGHPVLRAAVADLYAVQNPADTLILAPAEGIWFAMQALLAPGDHVVALFPAYQSLYEVARSLGCRVAQWALTPTPTGWQLDLDQLARCLTPQTRLLVLNFPHNPTGYLPTRDELAAILDLARRRGLYVFSDEMYRLLEYDPADRLPAVCDVYERGLSLSGLSKSFGLPGLRIGWLVTPDRAVLDRCAALKDYTTICSSAPSEVLAVMALRAGEAILARNRAIVRANLAAVARFCAAHPGQFTWRPPRAGSVAFPEWTGGGSVAAFCQKALDEQGVLLVPGSLFDMPGNHFRLGLGRQDLAAGLDCLGQMLGA